MHFLQNNFMNDSGRIWEIQDHTADVIIEGKGKTLETALEAVALALQNVMIDTSTIKPKKTIKDCIKIETHKNEEILFEFLSRLVFIKDVRKFFFNDIKVSIKNDNNIVEICFFLVGERLNLNRHKVFTDVKGISYSELKIFKQKDYYICRCIVDV